MLFSTSQFMTGYCPHLAECRHRVLYLQSDEWEMNVLQSSVNIPPDLMMKGQSLINEINVWAKDCPEEFLQCCPGARIVEHW